MWNEFMKQKPEVLTIEKVRESVQNQQNRRMNDMGKIKLKAWLYHSESRHKNGNPPFEFENFTRVLGRQGHIDYISHGLIDCEDLGGKEAAIEIVEQWYA